MDRIRSFLGWKREREEYQPVAEDQASMESSSLLSEDKDEAPFSWMEYGVFALLGMAMLWAWNMFLAAAPYFQMRFRDDVWITQNFQSAILTVFTITNLSSMAVLTNMQAKASYPFRINLALLVNVFTFALLTASASVFLGVSPAVYLAFLLVMVASTAYATGLIQNGAFAFAASFGRPEYMQALMAGQGVAGVLPPLAQIFSVLAVAEPGAGVGASSASSSSDDANDGSEGSTQGEVGQGSSSAFIYFLTAVAISIAALAAFVPLVRRHDRLIESRGMASSLASITSVESRRKTVSPLRLLRKLHWLAAAVALCFAVSMFFPVFTGKILSVRVGANNSTNNDEDDASAASASDVPRLLRPETFIPLAFFMWNAGDLSGRVATALPFSLRGRPPLLFVIAVARIAVLPMYLLCNVGGRGAVVSSDLFYLVVVQFLFGLTNGWLGASCMMAGGEWVDEGEREAAGGFMGLCLVAGLTVGSILSFSIAGI